MNKSAGCRRLEKNAEKSEDGVDAWCPIVKPNAAPVTVKVESNGHEGTPVSNGGNAGNSGNDGSSSPEGKKDEKRARARRSTSQVCYV